MLDVGSNVGVQIRKLFQPEKYPGATILPLFDDWMGPDRHMNPDVCAVGIEANPVHLDTLKRLEKCYLSKNWKTFFLAPYAASNVTGDTISFFGKKGATDGKGNNDWGAGILNFAFTVGRDAVEYHVPTIDVMEIVELLHPDATVYMKMDIEGSEWIVLPHMLSKGGLCANKISVATLEWHKWAIKKADKNKIGPESMVDKIASQVCNGTVVSTLDDESYLRDGVPLPCV